jgi:putative chitinase
MKEINRSYFFARVREALFDGRLSKRQVQGMTFLLDVWEEKYADKDIRWLAYCLATAKLETAHTMQPVEEAGKGRGKKYGVKTGPHKLIYYGRGHVQLTWERNYRTAGRAVGVDLVKEPEKALDPAISAHIMYEGMMQGWFTGKKLSDYIGATKCDFVGARRIVNGTDKAKMIAGYAKAFLDALEQSMQAVPEDEKIEGDQTTGKPVVKSTTILTQATTVLTTLGAGIISAFAEIPASNLLILVGGVAVLSALWTIKERYKKSVEEGV